MHTYGQSGNSNLPQRVFWMAEGNQSSQREPQSNMGKTPHSWNHDEDLDPGNSCATMPPPCLYIISVSSTNTGSLERITRRPLKQAHTYRWKWSLGLEHIQPLIQLPWNSQGLMPLQKGPMVAEFEPTTFGSPAWGPNPLSHTLLCNRTLIYMHLHVIRTEGSWRSMFLLHVPRVSRHRPFNAGHN